MKTKIIFTLTLLLCLFLNNNSSELNAQCPVTIQMLDINGATGFPEADEFVICGAMDTLAILIANNAGEVLTNVEMVVNLPTGMQHAGYEGVFDPAFPVAPANTSDLQNPTFLFPQLSDETAQVVYVGVETNCNAVTYTGDYIIDFELNYVFQDNNGFYFNCSDGYTTEEYNSSVKTPVLNIIDLSPQTLTLSNNNPACQTLRISQNGIGAYLEEFDVFWSGVEIGTDYNISSMTIAGAPVNYTYDSATTEVTAHLDPSSIPNGALFEDQFLDLEVCYEVAGGCDSETPINFTYNAQFGCNDVRCGDPVQADAVLRYAPNFGAIPQIEANLVQYPGICGDNTIFNISVQSAQTDYDLGVFEDLLVGFQICESDALDAVDVRVNGVSLDPSQYYYNNFDFVIDFTALTSDPDGPGVGIEDYDGDGFFDDLPGGHVFVGEIELELKCQDTGNVNGCGDISCSFQQAYVNAKRHCQAQFQEFSSITPPIDFSYGAIQVVADETNVNTATAPIFGYDFGDNGNNDNMTSVDIEFCYEFGSTNVGACPNSNIYYEIEVGGLPAIVRDLEPNYNNATWAGNPIAASDISQTYSADSLNTYIRFEAGADLAGLNCYNVTLELDSCVCYPWNYVGAHLRVFEECSTDGCTCTTVRACEETRLKSRRRCQCVCAVRDDLVELHRTSFGYADRAMTIPLDETTAAPEDLNRYLPCDSAYVHAEFEILDETVWEEDLTRMHFAIIGRAQNYDAYNPALELLPDFGNAEMVEFSFEGQSTGFVPDPVSFDNLDCDTGLGAMIYPGKPGQGYDSFNQFGYYAPTNSYAYNTAYDVLDNSRFNIYIYDRDRMTAQGIGNPATQYGDCVTDLLSRITPKNGDKFNIILKVPLQKNPYPELNADIASRAPETLYFRGYTWGGKDVGGQYSSYYGSCGTRYPIETFCPGDVDGETTLTIDNCSATVEQTFKLQNNVPDGWYENEFRPWLEWGKIETPLISPLVYAGNAEIVDYNGNVIPISDPYFDPDDASCVFYSGTNYCTENVGSNAFAEFDPTEFPLFGVGMPSIANDSMTLRYDLARICPGPIDNPSDFQVRYSHNYPCEFRGESYRCNRTTQNPNGIYGFFNENNLFPTCDCPGDNTNANSLRFECAGNIHERQDTSFTLNFSDVSGTFPSLSCDVQNLLLADLANQNEKNFYTVCSGTDGTEIHENVITSIVLPSAVSLMDVFDSSGNPLVYSLAGQTVETTTYAVELPDLNPGDCVDIQINTELIFCPIGLDIPTETCVTTVSSCLDPELGAQLLANGGDGCISTTCCYNYISDEAEIQADWIDFPTDEAQLCEIDTFAIVMKNVKPAQLVNLKALFTVPDGLQVISGSWESSYPGGPTNFGPWTSISDPPIVQQSGYGPRYLYPSDHLINSHIGQNGLQGVLATQDSSKVAIRFAAISQCEFVSARKIYFRGFASDPCEATINTGRVESPPYILQNANPVEFPVFTMLADPLEYACDSADIPLNINGINLSTTGGESDSTSVCLTLPPELVYTPGSYAFTAPSSFVPGFQTETVLPTGEVQICSDIPDGIGPQEFFAVQVKVTPADTTSCIELELGAEVKTLVPSQVCISTGEVCDVFVDNTLNPTFPIKIVAPVAMNSLVLIEQCDFDLNTSSYVFEIELEGVGGNFNSDVTVEFVRDLDLNGQLDSYDPVLATVVQAQSIPNGSIVNMTGTVQLQENFTCPMFVHLNFDVSCACDDLVFYNTTAPIPTFLELLDESYTICPNEDLEIEVCGDYDYSLTPSNGGSISQVGTDMTISINNGFGINTPVKFCVDSNEGSCSTNHCVDIYQLESIDVGPFNPVDVCEDECVLLDLGLSAGVLNSIDVVWTPTTFLDDPSSAAPMVCNPSSSQLYSVEVTYSGGCTTTAEFQMNQSEILPLSIDGETELCANHDSATLTAGGAYELYTWYLILPNGTNLIVGTTIIPEYDAVVGGTYYVEGTNSNSICPAQSATFEVTAIECIDLELTKTIINIPSPLSLGSQVTYEIEVCNILDRVRGMTFDATGVQVFDIMPGSVSYLGHTQTTGNYSPTVNEWTIGNIPSGTCETLLVDVTLDDYGPITNSAQVSGHDQPDVDSEHSNDDGDQSEDDEDNAVIEVLKFDLALTKVLSPTQAPTVNIGDNVSFTIEVCNQGEYDAYNVQVVDYIPTGMSTTDSNWSTGAVNEYFRTIPGPIAPGACEQIEIITSIDSIPTNGTFENVAEISGAEDVTGNNPPDIDSDPDNDPGNEGPVVDNDTANTSGDEDDHDPAIISVECSTDCIRGYGEFTIQKN